MGVAVTLGAQAQRECRQDEKRHSLFGGSEEESLPRLIEFETPTLFQLAKAFGVNYFAAAELERNDNASLCWNRKTVLLIRPTLGRDRPKGPRRDNDK